MTDSSLQSVLGREVFVSYASSDAGVANQLVEILEGSAISCWIAPRDVMPGAHYADEIIRGITGCKVLVLILSSSAIASKHVGKEVERAASKGRPIIALRMDASALTPGLEYFLSESQWVEVGAGGIGPAAAKVIAAIRRQPGSTAGHPVPSNSSAAEPSRPNEKRWLIPAVIAGALIAVIGGLWVTRFRVSTPPATSRTTSIPIDKAPEATAAVSDKSVAVLPFVDMSEKKDQEYFSDGLSEELINMLVKIPDLKVPARTSSFYFKGKQATIAEIARTLGVSQVLEGSVRRSGDHLRITAQLVRAETGYHLWSQTFDRKVDDIFKVQDEIAAAVAAALKITLNGEPLPRSTGTNNVVAYNLYLQAVSMQRHNDSRAGTESALGFIRQAIDADPKYAAAWARLALILDDLHFHQTRRAMKPHNASASKAAAARSWEQARDAVNEALRLDPNLAESHLAAARLLTSMENNRAAVEEHVRRALVLDPKDAFALDFAAQLTGQRGEFNKAVDLAKQAIDRDPADPGRYGVVADIYYHAGRYEDALAAGRKAWELAPSLSGQHWFASKVLFAKGEVEHALAELDLDPDAKTEYCLGCGFRVMMYDALNRKKDAEEALSRLKRDHSEDGAFEFARIYAQRGQLDLAFEWFDRAIAQQDDQLQWVKFDPLVNNVQRDPRFKELLHKLGLPD